MHKLLFCLSLLVTPLLAEPIDPNCTAFEEKRKEIFRTDTYDFRGEYPELKKIEIDATKKKRVEVFLTGVYPALKSIRYDGTFGAVQAHLTGAFPSIEQIAFLCGSSSMQLDFTGQWERCCEIALVASIADLTITLPEDVGVIVETKAGLKGKIDCKNSGLTKRKNGFVKKVYANKLAETHPIVLHFIVELREGTATFVSASQPTSIKSPSKETFLEGRKRKENPLLRVN